MNRRGFLGMLAAMVPAYPVPKTPTAPLRVRVTPQMRAFVKHVYRLKLL